MKVCDICNSSSHRGTIVKAQDMGNAARQGFDPYTSGRLSADNTALNTTVSKILKEQGMSEAQIRSYIANMPKPASPEHWKQSAISGSLSQSDWYICDICMVKLKPFLGDNANEHKAPALRKWWQFWR